jgi:predicted dehydrogenase
MKLPENENLPRITRRKFIAASAVVAGAMFIPSYVLGRTGQSPNNKLNIACIGVGGKGRGNLRGVGGMYWHNETDDEERTVKVLKGSGENIVALCDVDSNNLDSAASLYPKAKTFTDFRKMLETMDKTIDAVVISTPDHTHFPAAMMAIMMGKHVYVEKPMTHTVWEARQLTLAARKYKVATQMGNQGHAGQGIRRIKEWLNAGVIGPVHTVDFWTDRPIWPQGIERPEEAEKVPKHLDWELWLGPAPKRPYNSAYAPFKWRGWWDFGCGALGDMGCHVMDAAWWGLELGAPLSVEAATTPVNDETGPKSSVITYQFPVRGDTPPVTATWYDGDMQVPLPPELEPGRRIDKSGGTFIYGEKGIIMCGTYAGSPRIIPETKMKKLRSSLPPKTIPKSPGVYKEWIEACKGGKPAGSNFDVAGPFTETVLLGNVAIRARRKIEWDSKNLKITNLPEANKYIRSSYRKGWGVKDG